MDGERDTRRHGYAGPRRPTRTPTSRRTCRRARRALYRTAYLLAGDHAGAEDLLQNAFAKLYLSWDRIRDREALDGYVRRIMVNENNSLWRRAWKRREHSTDTMPETGAVDAYDDGMGGALWSFVQTLPPKQRSVVVLRYYEQLSEAETADVLGISVGTVKSQASRALAGAARPRPALPQPPRVRRRCTMNPTPLEDQVHDALHRRVDPLQHAPAHRHRRPHARPPHPAPPHRRWPAPRSPPSSPSPSPSGWPWSGRPAQRRPARDRAARTRSPAPSASTRAPRPVGDAARRAPHQRRRAEPDRRRRDRRPPPPLRPADAVRRRLGRHRAHRRGGGRAVAGPRRRLPRPRRDGTDPAAWPCRPTARASPGPSTTASRWTVVDRDPDGAREERRTALPAGPLDARVRPVGFLPGDELLLGTTDPATNRESASVVGRGRDHHTAARLAAGGLGVRGHRPRRRPDQVHRRRLLLGSASTPARGGAEVWQTCDYTLLGFSPDGRHLLGFTDYLTPDGSPTMAVLDAATGEPVVDFELVRRPHRRGRHQPGGGVGGRRHPRGHARGRQPAVRRTPRARRHGRAGRRRGRSPASRLQTALKLAAPGPAGLSGVTGASGSLE